MRFHSPLDGILRGRTALAVLRVLVRFPGKEFTGRELADLAGVAPSKAIVELDRLLRNGAVERRSIGRSHVWRARPGHFIFGALRPALVEEARVLEDLRAMLAKRLGGKGVREGWIHGSVARGEEEADSDVDVLLVVAREADKARLAPAVEEAARAVEARYGNRLHVVVYDAAEAARKRDLALLKAARRGIPFVGGPNA